MEEKTIAGIKPIKWGKDPFAYLDYQVKGSAKDRRKQLRAIRKAYPGHHIDCFAPVYFKTLNSVQVEVEDANTVRSKVRVYPTDKRPEVTHG